MESMKLGFAVEVVESLEVWAYLGGWGDGPLVQHPGARLFLTHVQDGQVFFEAGSGSSASPARAGGVFPEAGLDKVRRLNGAGPGLISLTALGESPRPALPPIPPGTASSLSRTPPGSGTA